MIGQRIGSYRITRLIGKGGMGSVFEAEHEAIRSRVAIKVLSPELARNQEVAQRFINEARSVNLVQHPSLVRIFDFGELPGGETYLVMEYLAGQSLRERIGAGAMALPDVLRLVRQLASALAAAHEKGIVHRDIKPENVIIVPDLEAPAGERAKLLDFGIAKVRESAELADTGDTGQGLLLGTPTYMSPEQCMGSVELDDKSDVYSLGVLLYEMLAGEPPFRSGSGGIGAILLMHMNQPPPPLRERAPQAPPGLLAMVDAMLAKRPASRPSMRQVVAAVEELGAPRASDPRPAPGPPPLAAPSLYFSTLGSMAPMPAPAMPDDIVRLIAEGGPYDGRIFDLPPLRELTLGRAVDNDLILDDPSLSREHAWLRRLGGGRLEVEDRNSANGTYVNGRKVDRAQLGPGDTLRFGELLFRLDGGALVPRAAAPRGSEEGWLKGAFRRLFGRKDGALAAPGLPPPTAPLPALDPGEEPSAEHPARDLPRHQVAHTGPLEEQAALRRAQQLAATPAAAHEEGADVFQLGLQLCELLTGEAPAAGEGPDELRQRLAGLAPGRPFSPLWRVTAIDRDGREVARCEIEHGDLTIGRDADRQMMLSSPSVSRRHCRVRFEDGAAVIMDEGSANGVIVNGVRITAPTPVNQLSRIEVAELRLQIEDLGPPRGARLGVLQVLGGNDRGRRCDLSRDVTRVGRQADQDLVLADISVSRLHLRIHRRPSGYRLQDLGSGNGTLVNGKRVEEVDLVSGDQIELGNTVLRFWLIAPAISAETQELVLRLLQPRPADRPAMAEVQAELSRLAARLDLPAPAPPISPMLADAQTVIFELPAPLMQQGPPVPPEEIPVPPVPPASPVDPATGLVIDGYRIEARLGEGSFADVYRATEEAAARPWSSSSSARTSPPTRSWSSASWTPPARSWRSAARSPSASSRWGRRPTGAPTW